VGTAALQEVCGSLFGVRHLFFWDANGKPQGPGCLYATRGVFERFPELCACVVEIDERPMLMVNEFSTTKESFQKSRLFEAFTARANTMTEAGLLKGGFFVIRDLSVDRGDDNAVQKYLEDTYKLTRVSVLSLQEHSASVFVPKKRKKGAEGQDPGVGLVRVENWGAIPSEARSHIEAGVERVRSVRDAISADAKVKRMPPITIYPSVWTPNGIGVVHALSGAWFSGQDDRVIGVLMGIGPTLCTDDSIVRKLLVHEFAHCFFIAKKITDHLDLGVLLDLRGDPMDEDRDRVMMVPPSEWFGSADAESIIGWDDTALGNSVAAELNPLLETRQVAWTAPPPGGGGGFPTVPSEWIEHIRALRTG
jgi:hypothetical protein